MKIFHFLIAVVLVWTVAGCGYSSPYAVETEYTAGEDGAMPLYISMWKNRTSELGFQSMIYHELIKWLKKSKRIRLTQSMEEAKYIIDGTIHSITFAGLSYDGDENALEVRAISSLSYALRTKETDKIVWQRSRYIRRDTFRLGNDSVVTSDNKRKQLKSIADNIAQEIYTKLFFTISREEEVNIEQIDHSERDR